MSIGPPQASSIRTAQAMDDAVESIGTWTAASSVDAQYRRQGFLQVSASPAQDEAWAEAAEACKRLGFADRWQALTREQVAERVRSPVFRDYNGAGGLASWPALG